MPLCTEQCGKRLDAEGFPDLDATTETLESISFLLQHCGRRATPPPLPLSNDHFEEPTGVANVKLTT